MVMIGFLGGLASQMNDYAFFLAMKRRYPDLEIKAVNGCFEHNGFELDRVFGIHLDWVDRRLAQHLVDFHIAPPGIARKICNVGHRMRVALLGARKTQLNMADYSSVEKMLPVEFLKESCAIWGNCANEVYQEVEKCLRKDFRFRCELTGENQELSSRIRAENSVSLHVRRGDYFEWGFRILGEDYYRAAIEAIERRVGNPAYYVFSDDLPCVKAMFRDLPNVTFVTRNRGKDSAVDMQLMSMCKHNIIANSGFSFMGAWLNDNAGKIVVSPRARNERDASVLSQWGWVQI